MKSSMAKLFLMLVFCACVMILSACKGVEIVPGDGGSVTVVPLDPNKNQTSNGNNQNGGNNVNNHSHVYQRDESSALVYDCTEGGFVNWVCYCGESFTESIAPKNHNLIFYDGKAATCTTDGYDAYSECTNPNCNYSTYSKIAATNHTLLAHEAKNATCTEFGWQAYEECKKCDYSTYVKIEAKGHDFVNGFCACGQKDLGLHEHQWNAGVVTTSSACTSVGILKFTCLDTNCGDTKTEEIPALGHDLTHYEAKAATCTEGGHYAYDVCNRCDYNTYVAASAVGHNIRTMSGLAATCTSDGYSDYELCTRGMCDGSGLKEKEVIAAFGHDLNYLPNIEATCTSVGFEDRVECKRNGCDYTTQKVVSALGHSLEHYEGNTATCTVDGYNAYDVCVRYGCNYSTYSVIPALGHDGVNYEAKDPDCTSFGWYAYSICKRCAHTTYIERDALGHNLVNGQCSRCEYFDDGFHTHVWNSGSVTFQPTCTVTGVKEYTCTTENCGNTKTEPVAPLGHDNTHYNKKDATCTEEGYYAYDVCDRCGYSTFTEISALGHKYDNGTAITQPTCTTKGNRRYSCVRSGCNKTYDVDENSTGHDWGNWFVTKDATCTESGLKQQICFNNSAHVNYETIPALGHELGDYIVQKAATCTEQGEKLCYCVRACGYKTPVEPITVIKHEVNAEGFCIICGQRINHPLVSPIVNNRSGDTIFWGAVNGAIEYELKIIYNGIEENLSTTATSYNLSQYHLECSELTVFIRAMSAPGSNVANSEYSEYRSVVPNGTVVEHGGIGNAVNLLAGPYTDYENGSKLSIFNTYVFNRLNVNDYSGQTPEHYTETVYSSSIREYTNKLTQKNTNKLSASVSAGVSKMFKVTAGYEYTVGTNYTETTYNNTQAIFYDINYTYKGYQTGIKSYIASLFTMSDADRDAVLENLTSASFRADAQRLQNGEITPAKFIELYGTNIITEAVYGASFNGHYERLQNNSKVTASFGENVEHNITECLDGTIKGVDFGIDLKNDMTLNSELFSELNTTDVYSTFSFTAKGGNQAVNMIALSFEEFSAVCDSWLTSIENESDYALIDIPDGSLYFVWDFLGEEYAEAKAILENYFYAVCDEQCKATNAKINSMSQDFFDFDDETGTLLVDLSGRQNPGSGNISLAGTTEYKNGSTVIFNGTTFTIYPKFNGKEIKKVVFKGGYMSRDYSTGQLITNYFTDLCIVFDDDWNEDIVIEFQNFGYEAPKENTALYFADVASENITVISNGEVYIKGGNGGHHGIDARGKNLAFEGSGILTIYGGDGNSGGNATTTGKCDRGPTGGVGGVGGKAVEAVKLTVDIIATMQGGNGGSGGNGGNGWSGMGPGDSHGGHGGSGGNGGCAIVVEELIIKSNANLTAIGGSGGRGGNGGKGQKYMLDDASGGYGGDGGNGAGSYNSACSIVNDGGVAYFIPGVGGSAGNGGAGDGDDGHYGGDGVPGSSGYNEIAATVYIDNKAYEVYNTLKTWDDAKSYAESKGGYLVTITSKEENENIARMLEYGSASEYYIGAKRAVDDQNIWAWVTGEEFDYANWSESEPNNGSGIEDYVGIYKSNCKWNDYRASTELGFIVEYDL